MLSNFILRQYLKMQYEGYNYYLFPHFEGSQDQQPIQHLIYEKQAAHHPHSLNDQDMPSLAEYPFTDQKKMNPTADVIDSLSTNQLSQISKQLTARNEISLQQKMIDKYKMTLKGLKDDTVELNINFKTLIVHYFKELKMLNELNSFEIKHVQQFQQRVPSFHSLMLFFKDIQQNQGIRNRCLELFSSSECLKKVIAGRSKIRTKIQMIKFIEKIRANILTKGKGYRWKDIIKPK